MWLLLGVINHGFLLRVPGSSPPDICRLKASSSSWIVTRSIPLVMVCSWTTASLSTKGVPRAPRPVAVIPQQRALEKLRVEPWIAQESVTGYKSVFADSAQALMSTVIQQPVRIANERGQSSFQSHRSGVWMRAGSEGCEHIHLHVHFLSSVHSYQLPLSQTLAHVIILRTRVGSSRA